MQVGVVSITDFALSVKLKVATSQIMVGQTSNINMHYFATIIIIVLKELNAISVTKHECFV